jgi:hypothetical protein
MQKGCVDHTLAELNFAVAAIVSVQGLLQTRQELNDVQ